MNKSEIALRKGEIELLKCKISVLKKINELREIRYSYNSVIEDIIHFKNFLKVKNANL